MSDPQDGLTDELRRVLHRDPAAGSRRAEADLLARVHAGARRRRARRAAGVGAVAVLAAGTVLAVALPLTERDADLAVARVSDAGGPEFSGTSPAEPTPWELADPPKVKSGSIPVEPTSVEARAVTASSRRELWVLGDAECAGADCVVIGHTDDRDRSPVEYQVGPGVPDTDMTMRMAANGEDGWVVSDGALFSTHDSADTWKAVEAPMATVDDVVTSPSSVWVTGEREGETVVATAPVDKDEFADAELPEAVSGAGRPGEPVVTEAPDGERFGFLHEADGSATFVAYEEAAGWNSYETPDCRYAFSLSGTDSALWAICDRAQGLTPMVSSDGGLTWELVEVDQSLGNDSRIGAIDPDRAVVHTSNELWLLNGGQMLRAEPPAEGAGSKRYDYLGFVDDDTGFLIDSEGVLSRSDNGGTTWEPVELP